MSDSGQSHSAAIADQFTRQAKGFAAAGELHNDEVLALMTTAAFPLRTDRMLDVACGPGSVVTAFAPLVFQATGIDATEAMLAEGRKRASAMGLANVEWQLGNVYDLPYEDRSIDIVTTRFAFHHLENPAAAFAEMKRVARSGARVVLCDAVTADDELKAQALNEMEQWRDPSTTEFRSLAYLRSLFLDAGLSEPLMTKFQVPYVAHELVASSFPARDDRIGLLDLIERSVDGDRLGMNARRIAGGVQIAFQSVVLTSTVL